MKQVKISASILCCDFSDLRTQINRAEKSGVDIIHIDVMDGHFVPNLTIGPCVIKSIRKHTKLPIEAHLMIKNPDSYLDAFIEAGSNIIIVHAETCPHLHRTIQYLKEKETVKIGIALNPGTTFQIVEPIIGDIDMILVMTVNPGFSGQKFIHSMINKILKASEFINMQNLDIEIGVDGGINVNTAKFALNAGATVLVSASGIFGEDGTGNIEENVKKLKDVIREITKSNI